MGLAGKILLFIAALVVLLVGGTLAFTTVQADRLARATIDAGLKETRGVWQAIQADRFDKLKLGCASSRTTPTSRPPSPSGTRPPPSTRSGAGPGSRGRLHAGDRLRGRAGRRSEPALGNLRPPFGDPIVRRALDGEDSATLWRQGDQLFTAVAVPMQTGPDLVGVLVAGYGLNEAVASQIRRLTHSEIAFLVEVPASRRGSSSPPWAPRGRPRRRGVAPGARPGGDDALRDRPRRRAPHRRADPAEDGRRRRDRCGARPAELVRGNRSLPPVPERPRARVPGRHGPRARGGLGRRLPHHRPVRTLVSLVERARDGSYAGAVSVQSRDEIGVLARAFNALLADLREKDR